MNFHAAIFLDHFHLLLSAKAQNDVNLGAKQALDHFLVGGLGLDPACHLAGLALLVILPCHAVQFLLGPVQQPALASVLVAHAVYHYDRVTGSLSGDDRVFVGVWTERRLKVHHVKIELVGVVPGAS